MESVAKSGERGAREGRAAALLTVPEVARLLNVSEARTRELARQHLIPVVRLGRQLRFDPDAIQAWIADGGQALPGGWRREPE